MSIRLIPINFRVLLNRKLPLSFLKSALVPAKTVINYTEFFIFLPIQDEIIPPSSRA